MNMEQGHELTLCHGPGVKLGMSACAESVGNGGDVNPVEVRGVCQSV